MAVKRITMLTRLLDVNTSRRGILPPSADKPRFEYGTKDTDMPKDIPENQGISSRDIADYLSELDADKSLNMHSILIARNGRVLCEAYFGSYKRGLWKATFSACKSVISIAIGMLIDEGRLSLHTRLDEIFAKEMNTLEKAMMRGMTVYDLLTMQSGMTFFDETEMMNMKGIFKSYVSTPLSYAPREKYYYNSANTYMLSCIVKKVSGEGICDFLEDRLFAPLGIKNYYWEKSAEGIEYGGWGLYITPNDFAKIGMMVMNGGVWNGRRIVSKKYIDSATKAHAKSNDSEYGFNYGFQMWVGKSGDQFLFNGMLGQNVWGFRKNGIIIVSNAGNDELFQSSNYFEITQRYFDRKFPEKLQKSFINRRYLDKTLQKIGISRNFATLSKREISKYKRGALPRECGELDGRTLVCDDRRSATVGILPLVWQVLENNYSQGFDSVSFDTDGGKMYLTYAQKDEKYRFAIGFGEPEYSYITIHGASFYIAATGCFASNEDGERVFKIRIDFLETPCSLVLKLIYKNGYFEMWQKELPGKLFVYNRILQVKGYYSDTPLIKNIFNIAPNDFFEAQVERLLEFKFKLHDKQ